MQFSTVPGIGSETGEVQFNVVPDEFRDVQFNDVPVVMEEGEWFEDVQFNDVPVADR